MTQKNYPSTEKVKLSYYNWSSEIYGFGQIYRKIAKYPSKIPLFFTSDHGVSFPGGTPNYAIDAKPRAIFHLTWTPWIKESQGDWSKGPFKIGIKHPYFLVRMPNISVSNEKVTFFPCHTVPGEVLTGLDDERTIQMLNETNLKGVATRVCLHWHDWNTERRERFLNHTDTITAGDSLSPNFAKNIMTILVESNEIISENVGSQVLYALALGKRITFLESEIDIKDALIPSHETKEYQRATIEKILSYQESALDEIKKKLLRDFLGFDYLWSRTKIFLVCWGSLLCVGPFWLWSKMIQKKSIRATI